MTSLSQYNHIGVKSRNQKNLALHASCACQPQSGSRGEPSRHRCLLFASRSCNSGLDDDRHSLHLKPHTLGFFKSAWRLLASPSAQRWLTTDIACISGYILWGASTVQTARQPAYLHTSSKPSQNTFAQYLRMSRCCSSIKVQCYLHNKNDTLQQMVHVAKVLSRQAGLFWASRYLLCKGVEQIRRYTRRSYTVNAASRIARQCRVNIMCNTSSPVV